MKSRLPEAPALKVQSGVIGAAAYNRVRLVFSRLGSPQELLLGVRGLHFHLDREVWLCSDRRLNDAPLVAWTHFEHRHRAGVHAPIRCEVLYYHAYARVVAATVLTEVDKRLEARLQEDREAGPPLAGPRVVHMRQLMETPRIR
jgi:hypothetical protein